MLLNSSLNVELVYIILKSITSFCCSDQTSKETIDVDEATGDAKLKLEQIKIKNYQSWSRKSNVLSKSEVRRQEIVLKEHVNVTYYRRKGFMSAFTEFFS